MRRLRNGLFSFLPFLMVIGCNTYSVDAYPDITSDPGMIQFTGIKALEEESKDVRIINNSDIGTLHLTDIFIAHTGCEFGPADDIELSFSLSLSNDTSVESLSAIELRPRDYLNVHLTYAPKDTVDDLYYLCVKSDSPKKAILDVLVNGYVDTPKLYLSVTDPDNLISFEGNVLDFGRVSAPLLLEGFDPYLGESRTGVFSFTNTGSAPLIIENIECNMADSFFAMTTGIETADSACGTSFTLDPGAKKEVLVAFTPGEYKKASKEYDATVRLYTNDPEHRIVDVIFQGLGINPKTPPLPVIKIRNITPGERFPVYVIDGGESVDYDNANEGLPLKVSKYKWDIVPLDCQWAVSEEEAGVCLGEKQELEPLLDNDKLYSQARFIPKQAGRYKIKLSVTDNEIPPETSEGEMIITVPYDYDIYVKLSWESPVEGKDVDLDLHFLRNPGNLFEAENDCYYANNLIDWGVPDDTSDDVRLLADSITRGSEIISLSHPEQTKYRPVVHFYSGSLSGETGESIPVHAVLKVYLDGILKYNEYYDLQQEDCFWHPFKDITWDGTQYTVQRSELVKGEVICDSTIIW